MEKGKSLALPLLLAGGALTLLGLPAIAGRTAVTRAGEVSVDTPRGRVQVTPLTKSIFRVTHIPSQDAPRFQPSQSVVLEAEEVGGIGSTVFADYVEMASPDATVRIDKESGAVSFYAPDGTLLLAEGEGIDNATPGLKSVRLLNTGTQNFFGAGERGHRLRLNGDTLSMYNRQNYGYTEGDPRISQMGISVPYIVSDKGYGILFDDYARGELILASDTITYSSQTPLGLSYYVMTGENGSDLDALIEDYTLLTGRQPLPPLWTLGYITSKYGYKTQQEAEEVVERFRQGGYPLDGMVLDLYWYGVEQDMGRLEWNLGQWPDHKKMLKDFADKGINIVTISQPYVNKGGAIDNYNLLSEAGMLARDAEGKTHDVTTWVGDAGMIDVSNPDTRSWLWNRLKGLTEEGIAGWWGDLGEPEVHPSTIVHANGQSAEEYHNVYGNEWSRLIYEGLRKDFPDKRPMLMMRGGTAGLQRYGVFPWTTDVSRSWGGLQPQVKLMLSSGLSGLGYMGSDVGGFAVDEANPTDEELYVRWLQMGTFSPMLRTHAQLLPEPYNYPAVEEISKKFIDMRYRWLPYNYTLAYENAAHGYPLARPLNFRGENPGEKYADVADEYMWGDEVLVAPVMTKGARQRKVLFPAGEWINWNNPSLRYKGGTTAVVAAPLGELPMFVRSGSFIPQFEGKVSNVGDYNPQTLTVLYFPSESKSSYTLFDDDRKSPTSLEEGAFQLTTFTGERSGGQIRIGISTNGGHYEGISPYRQLTFEIVGVASKPKGVSVDNGMTLEEKGDAGRLGQSGWSYDSVKKRLYVRLPWEYDRVELTVE